MLFNKMKLKTRVIIDYGLVLIIVASVLVYGIRGLFSINLSFNEYGDLLDEANMVYRLEQELQVSRLSYKHFLTSKDPVAITDFNTSYELMMDEIDYLKKNGHSDIQSHVRTIDDYLDSYNQYFQEIQQINAESLENYNSIAAIGYDMLGELEYMNQDTFISNYENLHYHSSNSLIHLLAARLRATKYFDFHLQEDYDNYKFRFGKYQDELIDLSSYPESDTYEDAIDTLIFNAVVYGDKMDLLYEQIVLEDALVVELDNIGPSILAESEAIINIVDQIRTDSEDALGNNIRTRSVGMSILAVIAIVFLVFSGFRILRAFLQPIRALTTTFTEIAEGDTDTSFRLDGKRQDEIGEMSRAFNGFMEELSEIMTEVEYNGLLRTGQSELQDVSKDETDIEVVSDNILDYLVEYLDGVVGRIYVYDNDEKYYKNLAGYGVKGDRSLQVSSATGIIGEVISGGKPVILGDIDKTYMDIETGLGSMAPNHLYILPCFYEDDVIAIIEIGRIDTFNKRDKELIDGLGQVIGSVIHSALLRHEMRTLLEKTIHQSEELQMQQEELRQSNEELEEQTRALKESEQRLHAQQEELRVSNEELEERSKQLQFQKEELDVKNKAIVASQDEIMEKAHALEQANRYKSEFLANMSHELRTPLNSILVLSQLLSHRENNKPLTDKEQEFANTIHTAGGDLLTLINGVLDLSKVEAGRLDLVIEDIRLSQLKDESMSLFKPMADIRGIEFDIKVVKGMPELIESDHMRLNQIIKNLISNAIKFTHEGFVALYFRKPTEFECEKVGMDYDRHFAIEVKDTGIGVEPDKQELIFEAFRQMDGTTSRNYGGTGLGLTISLELASLLGGKILLESTVGEGSSFVLVLPLAYEGKLAITDKKSLGVSVDEIAHEVEAHNSTHKVLETKEDKEIDEPLMTEPIGVDTTEIEIDSLEDDNVGKSLLIVEDDDGFANVLGHLAREKGYEPLIANTGLEGIKLAVKHLPEAIILDLGLPDIEGMEVVKRLESHAETKDIPVHIISGREQMIEGDIPKSIIGTLKKPVDIKTIYQTLAKIEKVSTGDIDRLLVVGHCGGESFEHFTNLSQIVVEKVTSGKEGLEELTREVYGCIVLDTKLEDMTGLEFMSQLNESEFNRIPVVIYTDEAINMEEFDSMNQFAESVIMKSEKSKERLSDEVTLFLHNMQKQSDVEVTSHGTHSKDQIKKVLSENTLLGKRILLVDDDERNVFALMHALEAHGMEVIVAKDGMNAIEKYNKHSNLDLILMDIMMPKMDGYEAISEIRKLESTNHVPIIALTAKAMAEDRDKCIDAGANDYMTKPIDVDKLLSLMKVWVS